MRTERAVEYEGTWWRGLDGEPAEGPAGSASEVDALITRLEHSRRGPKRAPGPARWALPPWTGPESPQSPVRIAESDDVVTER